MKDELTRIFVMLVFIVIVIFALNVVNKLKETKRYEYYTFNNEFGISSNCTNKDLIECEIKGIMVEVNQYSEIK